MDTSVLRSIGLTENEIKIYLTLLEKGTSTAYEISQQTGIYRVHVYDKLEQLMDKGMVTQSYQAAKKFFNATPPEKFKQYLEEKKRRVEEQETAIDALMPELKRLQEYPREDTKVDVFRGEEGLKYFLKDVIKTKPKEVLIMGIEDTNYEKHMPTYIRQYFRDLKHNNIKERVITAGRKGVFLFDQKTAPTTTYRFLPESEFKLSDTMIYADKIVIVTWGSPITAILIKNKGLAAAYTTNFEQLWKIAKKRVKKRIERVC